MTIEKIAFFVHRVVNMPNNVAKQFTPISKRPSGVSMSVNLIQNMGNVWEVALLTTVVGDFDLQMHPSSLWKTVSVHPLIDQCIHPFVHLSVGPSIYRFIHHWLKSMKINALKSRGCHWPTWPFLNLYNLYLIFSFTSLVLFIVSMSFSYYFSIVLMSY